MPTISPENLRCLKNYRKLNRPYREETYEFERIIRALCVDYGTIRDKMRSILNHYDPIGIFGGNDINIDEYDPEIMMIVAAFCCSADKAELFTEVHSIFIRMFSAKLAGKKRRYTDLTSEIYDLLINTSLSSSSSSSKA